MVNYPATLDNTLTLPTVTNDVTPPDQTLFNNLRDAILALERELGANAKKGYTNTSDRITALETATGSITPIALAQDLGHTVGAPYVVGLQGRPLSGTTPGLNNVITWDGSQWKPAPAQSVSSVTFAGDLSGNDTSQTVIGFRGISFLGTSPSACTKISMPTLRTS